MNGTRALALMAVLVTSALGEVCFRAECAEVTISGTVILEGAADDAVLEGLRLEAVPQGGRAGRTGVDKDGRYSVTVDVPGGAKVVLRARDGTWLRGHSKSAVIGHAVVEVPDRARRLEMDLPLKSVAVVLRSIRVVTGDGRPAAGRVKCKAELAGTGEGDIPLQTWQWNVDAADDGSFSVGVPEGVKGTFAFKVDRLGKDRARYVGRDEMSFAALTAAAAPIPLLVKRKALSLEVHFKWDESFSREPFRPNVGGAIFSHVVVVNGPVHPETLMDGKGIARFYALPAGDYTIQLGGRGRPLYTVKQAPKSVKIAAGDGVPIKVDILIVPVKAIVLSGRVIDATNGTPVAGARVTAAERYFAKTSADGRFILEGVIPDGSAIAVRHSSYCPADFELGKPGEQGDLKVRPLPLFHGTVMRGPKGPGVPNARLMCRGTPRSVKVIADEKGDFATRIPPGKYRLTIKQFYPEDKVAEGRRKVTVYESSLEIPPEGLKQNFIVSGIGEVTIRIKNAEGAEKADTRKLNACLLRAADGKILAGSQVNMDDMTVMLAAQPGDYRILVLPNKQMGQVCSDVKIEAGKRKRVAITLGRWVPIRLRDDGTVKVGEQ